MAGYGDFSLYGNLYGQDTANTMREVWIAQNPLLAYNTGTIDAERYRSITGQYPPGYTAPAATGGYYGGSGRSKPTQVSMGYDPTTALQEQIAQRARERIAASKQYNPNTGGAGNGSVLKGNVVVPY